MSNRRSYRRPAFDAQEVDVPEAEGPAELRTETMIASIAVLAGRLFKRRALELSRSYQTLATAPTGPISELVDRWAVQQAEQLARGRQATVRPLTERYLQFEQQLNRQIDKQLVSIGAMAQPTPRPWATGLPPGLTIPLVSRPTDRESARRLERTVQLVANGIERRLQGLVEQAQVAATAATLYGSTELPAMEFGAKTRAAVKATQRQAVDLTWSYQTATMGERYKAAGVRYAEWRSQRDTRVRPKHKDRDGKIYDLKKGLDGAWPGSETLCRCYPIPKRPGYEP